MSLIYSNNDDHLVIYTDHFMFHEKMFKNNVTVHEITIFKEYIIVKYNAAYCALHRNGINIHYCGSWMDQKFMEYKETLYRSYYYPNDSRIGAIIGGDDALNIAVEATDPLTMMYILFNDQGNDINLMEVNLGFVIYPKKLTMFINRDSFPDIMFYYTDH